MVLSLPNAISISAAFVAATLLLPLAAEAQSQGASSQINGLKLSNDQPIQIESDQLEIKEQEKSAVFSGNVSVLQGTTTLKSGHMIVHYKSGGRSMTAGNTDIEKIDLSGGVLLNSGTQQATGDTGSFVMASQIFVLEGKQVVLSDQQNVFVGCKLTVHANTGEAHLEACGGRVRIQLDPNSQKKK
nr:LptA/OstA family protein [uncultured Gellertiella sp.]